MNPTQMKYAEGRAKAILNVRTTKITEMYKSTVMGKKEQLEALKKGQFTIKENGGYYWYNAVIFNGKKDVGAPKREAALSALKKAYDKLMDNLFLGDSEAALHLLQEFEGEK